MTKSCLLRYLDTSHLFTLGAHFDGSCTLRIFFHLQRNSHCLHTYPKFAGKCLRIGDITQILSVCTYGLLHMGLLLIFYIQFRRVERFAPETLSDVIRWQYRGRRI
jgi:hypothetical protein